MIPLIEPCHAHFKPCLVKFKLELVHIQCFFSCGNCGMHCMHCQKWAGRANPLSVSWGRQILLLLFFSVLLSPLSGTFLLQVATFDNFSDYIWVLTLTCTAQRWKAERSCTGCAAISWVAFEAGCWGPSLYFPPHHPPYQWSCKSHSKTSDWFSVHPSVSSHGFRALTSGNYKLFFSSCKIGCEKLMLMFQGQRKSGQVWDY